MNKDERQVIGRVVHRQFRRFMSGKIAGEDTQDLVSGQPPVFVHNQLCLWVARLKWALDEMLDKTLDKFDGEARLFAFGRFEKLALRFMGTRIEEFEKRFVHVPKDQAWAASLDRFRIGFRNTLIAKGKNVKAQEELSV